MTIVLIVLIMVLLAAPAGAQQSCEEQRDMFRALIQNMRQQRAVTEIDLAQEVSKLQRENAGLRAEVEKLKKAAAKPEGEKPEPPKVDGQ